MWICLRNPRKVWEEFLEVFGKFSPKPKVDLEVVERALLISYYYNACLTN